MMLPRARHPGVWSQVGLGSITTNKAGGGDGIPVRWCCESAQYASKCGKLSSGHRTGKGLFSFQSQRKGMPKNAQTTAQLHSSHTLGMWGSTFSKPGFSNTWTVKFQMFKLDLEKAEEPMTSAGSSKISSNEMDQTGAHYTEWSKPERERPLQYTKTYVWNLVRW